MACRSPIKCPLTRALPLCLLIGLGVAGEVAYAQTPVVSGVTIDNPVSGDTFELGEIMTVNVTFDRDVEVTGFPNLSLTIGTATPVSAWIQRTTGPASTWRFTWVVLAQDRDADGISIGTNALTLNGGTIKISGGTTDANLSLGTHAITNSTNHKVDGSRATAPAVMSVYFASSPSSDDTFELGEAIRVTVWFDRAISVTGPSELALTIGGQTRQALVDVQGRGLSTVSFLYVVQSNDRDLNGVSVDSDALTLNGGITVSGGTTGAAASLGSRAIRNSGRHKVDGSRETAPTVTGVSIESSPDVGDTYELGETITVVVRFNRAVAVAGSPQLVLTMDNARQASFAGLQRSPWPPIPGAAASFQYTVQSADNDADGLSIGANALTLNGGTIKIAGGSTDAALNLGSHAIANSGDHKVNGSLESAPVVTSVSLRSDIFPRSSDTFEFGQNILVLVGFDREVRVTGTPQVALTIDAQMRQASFDWIAGGGRWMWFRYVVQSADSDADGISIGANALTLNGGTIVRKVGTTNAVLGFGARAITNSDNHKVDGSRERAVLTSVRYSRPASGETFEQGETIQIRAYFRRVMAVTGKPQFALKIGARTRQAYFVLPANDPFHLSPCCYGTSLVFRYTVQPDDRDTDGISTATDALTLNGGTIRIQGSTTDAVLTVPSEWTLSNSAIHKVNGGGGTGGPMDVRVESAVAGLRVSWQAVAGASAYKVEWRVVGGTWMSSRQAETTETQYEIAGLDAGDYEVRVIAVVDGEDGEASVPTRGEVPEFGNRGPRVADELPNLEVDVGETVAVDVTATFEDVDGDRLRYSASSDAGFVAVTLADGIVRVRGVRPGEATVSVTAEDPAGLTATATFQVAVGALLTLTSERTAAPEGGTVVFGLELSRPLAAATAVRWRLAADEDASTADADVADYGAAGGEVSIPAGETSATIEIAIADDTDIEPAREHFVVQLEQPEDENVGLARNTQAGGIIQEGVCDRTAVVRDELSRQWQGCHWLRPSTLAAVRSLDLSGRNINALRSNDLLGLRGLRRLDLSDNTLEVLPVGLFAGLQRLGEISVEGNPGAPFALTVELARLDADPWAPGPARVAAQTAWAAPFSLEAALSVSPADVVAGELPTTVDIVAGAMAGRPFRAASNNGVALTLSADAAMLPTTQCRSRPCFRGFQTVPGPPLTLFRQPPRALPAPTLEPLQGGDELRLPLASLIQAEDPLEELHSEATSSDEALATVRIVDGSVVVTPELASAGTVEVALVVTDTAGLSTTLRFDVPVEFHWPRGPASGWRSAILPRP